MEDFEKYYGIRIIINNKKVLKYSYNGKFRQADGLDSVSYTHLIIEEIEKVIDEAKKQIEIPNEA